MIELVNEIYHVKDDLDRAGEVRLATETAGSLIQPELRATAIEF